jgi:hypothetical protein
MLGEEAEDGVGVENVGVGCLAQRPRCRQKSRGEANLQAVRSMTFNVYFI